MQYFKNIPNFILTFFGINKLSSIIKEVLHKDTLPTIFHSNVKICCLHCIICRTNL